MHPFTQHDVPDGAAAVHWFEQSSFAVRDAAGTLTLVDPYSPHDRPADRFIHAKPPMDEAEWPAHFVLLTHAHGDHTNPETLARLHAGTPDARYLGPQEAIDQLVEETPIAPAQCTAVSAGDRVQIGTMALNVVYAKPPDGDPNAGIEPPDTPHLGYVVEAGQHRLYFTGDPINTFAEHESLTAPVAALQPTVAFLTNHPTEGEFPYFDGCVRMATRCRVGIACPAHYACFVARNYDPAEVGRRLPGWRTVDPHHPAQLARRLRGVTAQAVLVEEALADGRLRLPSPTAPSFVDLVNAIHRGAGVPVAPTPHSGELGEHLFDRDHLVIVLVDGMGMAALDDPAYADLRSRVCMELDSVYPATTACAITTVATGLWPGRHGVPGWYAYLEERDLSVTVLPYTERDSGRGLSRLGVQFRELWPEPSRFGEATGDVEIHMPARYVRSTFNRYLSGRCRARGYRSLKQAARRIRSRSRRLQRRGRRQGGDLLVHPSLRHHVS